MATKNSSHVVYLVLNVTQGVRFDRWRGIRLRIASSLEKEMMISHHFYVTGEPIFNMYFVWCMTKRHLRLLQSLETEIVIAIVEEESGEICTLGCAGLGIQHAQLHTPHIELHSRQLDVVLFNAPKGTGLQPELAVTLTIQSKLPEDIRAQIHVAYLREPPEAKQEPGCSTNTLNGSILESDAAPSTSANVQQEDSSERNPSLKPNERKPSNLSETNTNKGTKNVRFQDEL